LLAVELKTTHGRLPATNGGLVVALKSGRKIEVHRGFDLATLERLVNILEWSGRNHVRIWSGHVKRSGISPARIFLIDQLDHVPAGMHATTDADGRMTYDCMHTYSWDVHGNMFSVDSTTMNYDAFDRVVEKNSSGSFPQIVYSPSGRSLRS
jgi:hypothetical protein